jgi:hypothetical protein
MDRQRFPAAVRMALTTTTSPFLWLVKTSTSCPASVQLRRSSEAAAISLKRAISSMVIDFAGAVSVRLRPMPFESVPDARGVMAHRQL